MGVSIKQNFSFASPRTDWAVLVSESGFCRDEDLFKQTGFPTVEALGVECLRESEVLIV